MRESSSLAPPRMAAIIGRRTWPRPCSLGSTSTRRAIACPGPAPRGPASLRAPARSPVHQPVLLARSRIDGPAPGRPGRVAGRARYECHVLCAGAATSPASPIRRLRGPRGCAHPPDVRRPRWAGAAPGPDDRLPELLRAVPFSRRSCLPRFDAVVTLTTPADHRAGRHAPETAQGVAACLLEHGPSPRRQPGTGPDVAAKPGWSAAADRLSAFCLPAGRSVVVLGPVHGRSDRAQGGRRATASTTIPVWSRTRRDLPDPARGQRAAEVARPGRRFRRDVLGQPGSGPFVRRVPRGRTAAPRSVATSSSCSWAAGRDWMKSRPRSKREGLANIRFLDYVPRGSLAHLAVDGRRPPDLDAARDDRASWCRASSTA